MTDRKWQLSHWAGALLLAGTGLVGCGGGDSSASSDSGTAGVKCGVSDSGTQRLQYTNTGSGGNTSVDQTLAFSYSWSCSSTLRSLTGNGIPNHAVTNGMFATNIATQSISASYTLSPAQASSATSVQLPGYAINSVKFEPGTAGTCPSSATASSDCNYAGGSGTWRMEALPGSVSPWKFDFGTDTSNAHVQPNGQYHYHGMPEGLIAKLNASSATSMTLVGWASDGFPMYARYGYSNAADATSALKVMTGSYRVKTTPDASRPSTTYFPMGHFVQDWEYVAGLGDLDECNGRSGVTPEFPNGTYHYYVTESYPFVQRCVKGTVSTTSSAGGAPPPP
jgi:hypothetical protein